MTRLIAPERRPYRAGLFRTSLMVHKKTWDQFRALVEAKGMTAGEGVRQLMAEAIRRENARG